VKWSIPVNDRISVLYAMSIYSFLENKELGVKGSFIDGLKQSVEFFVNSYPDINKKLCSPLISKENKIDLISKIFNKKLDNNVLGFLSILIHRNRFDFLESIYKAFVNILDEKSGVLKGEVHLAKKTDKKRQEEIITSLSSITGKKVKPDFIEDNSLLAGFNTMIGNYYIDYSLRGQLEQLELELKRS
jgi:F-type H+-transporting ATPase subunit delta